MKFFYTSVASNGERKSGTREASDKFQLANDLKAEGEMVLSAKEIASNHFFSFKLSFFNRVKTHEKIIFARNLASMLDAGLSLSRSLSVIERQTKRAGLKNENLYLRQ